MFIAVEGCCHGELDKIYETLQDIEKREKIEIDLLLCCGDFQAVRNEADLQCMAVPDKHKSMQDFWQYYSGKKKAPYMTIFIGGNHEASNYLQELPYGGWVAPNIYYLGYAGIVNYKGVRIGGVSGIFKQHDYTKGRYEKPPYNQHTKRSVYHVRHLDVFRLKQLKQPVDIMMSHDWPNGVVNHGNKEELLRRKKYFEDDIRMNRLGSLPSWQLLTTLKPNYWFSGHLHVKFAAFVKHNADLNEPSQRTGTRFLALDKCLPRRDFLQILSIPTPDNALDGLYYDAEWMTVLKETNDLTSTSPNSSILPTKGLHEKWDYSVSEQQIKQVLDAFEGDLKVPLNFREEASCIYDPQQHRYNRPVDCRINQQTTELCGQLEINDPLMIVLQQSDGGNVSLNSSSWMSENVDDVPSAIISNASINPDEIDIEDDDEDQPSENTDSSKKTSTALSMDEARMASSLSSLSSTEEESDSSKTTGKSHIGQRLSARFSLDLPPPSNVHLASTPTSKRLPDRDTEPFSPIATSDSDSATQITTGCKRSSESDNEMPEDGESALKTKRFKRRNASLYTSQSEEDAT